MRYQKQIISFLIFGVFFVVCINIYYLFFYQTPIKRPNYDGIADEIDQDLENEFARPVADENISTSKANTYVSVIPIPIDETMDTHLAEFRSKAKYLQQKYPNSFFISIPTDKKVVALTFDDGPDKDSTIKIIRILNKYNVPGTFFFIGNQMDKYSETVNAALTDGHTIVNHSWAHLRSTDSSIDELIEEVKRTQNSIDSFTTSPKLFRPPYGLVNDEQMPELIDTGFKVVAWSIDSMDWYFTNSEDIVTCVVDAIHPGAIVLMHSAGGSSNRQATIDALPKIIETLQNLGYSFVTLDELSK